MSYPFCARCRCFEVKKMTGFRIYLSQVWAEFRQLGLDGHPAFADIEYRVEEGRHGEKVRVSRRAGKYPERTERRELDALERQQREAGKMHLLTQHGQPFDLWLPLLVRWNGKLIDHRF